MPRRTERVAEEPNLTPSSVMNVAESGVAFEGRASYETWLLGKSAGTDIGSVFSAGTGAQLDAGLILDRGLILYAGWLHTFYGVGAGNPYANLPTASAHGDYFMLGLRGGCGKTETKVGFDILADAGYQTLGASGSDNAGGSASVSMGNLVFRGGAGVCIRPTGALLIAPTAILTSSMSIGGESSSVVVHGVTKDTSADLKGSSFTLALSPGVSITGELPF